MTQQPFSRPGAVDLSDMSATAPNAATPGDFDPAGQAGSSSPYAVVVDEQNLQGVLADSTKAPVLLVFFSAGRMPESRQLAHDIETLSSEFEGRFLAGLVDVDVTPSLAAAMQVPSIPLVVVVLDGRPMPLLQEVVPLAELRTAMTQILQQFTAQGITGRHQPRAVAAETAPGETEPAADPRYAAAQDALADGDIDRAVVEYQKLVDANPADAEAAAGLAMARVLQRTAGVDLNAARAAAAADPDDVDAQVMAADLDLLGGHVDDAFTRLIDTVRRTTGDDRDRTRHHLLDLFAAVGNADQRVLRARQNLASALF
ncbi:MAG: co-chaperone YbbN [Nocardioides sp.]